MVFVIGQGQTNLIDIVMIYIGYLNINNFGDVRVVVRLFFDQKGYRWQVSRKV